MNITLSPTRGLPGQAETTLSVTGDTLTIDGIKYNMSPIPEGGQGTPEGDTPFIGPVRRLDGEIVCTVRVQLGDDASPDQPTDPSRWTLTVGSGDINIPAERLPAPEDAQ